MALVRGAPQLLVETNINGSIGYEDRLGRTIALANGPYPIPGFAPRLLASLVASSTAACTSGVVTVTATAHGIPSTVFNGWQIYYPGSTSLSAGWYDSLNRTGADTITFSAPSAENFASESVNGDAAVTTEVTVISIDLPANTMSVGDTGFLDFMHAGDGTTNAKVTKLKLGTTRLVEQSITSASSNILTTFGFCVPLMNQQMGLNARAHTAIATRYAGTEDLSLSLYVSLTATLAAAGSYLGVPVAKLRIQ